LPLHRIGVIAQIRENLGGRVMLVSMVKGAIVVFGEFPVYES